MEWSYSDFQTAALAEFDSIVRVARSLSRNSSESDDLVQDCYFRAMRAWQSFTPGDRGIRPWLMTILHNAFYNQLAKGKRQKQFVDEDQLTQLPQRESSTPVAVDWQQFDGRLRAAMDALPPPIRATLTMWALEDLTYREIAEAMQVPIGTVMSRLHRGRAMLHERLSGLAAERGIGRE
jgi:RNA polymerase sigma-70 factor, ECF subfamily